ncbi:MAG TPA: HEAT repeat domain-containing protein, partial [Thermoguttaceae bacterium]|nr:HEAT repeat domain-containing protein [Thermoguttaceae bacterium]
SNIVIVLGAPGLVERLLDLLGDDDGRVREIAANLLKELGEPKWSLLVGAHETKYFDLLAEEENSRGIAPLLKALESEVHWRRHNAADSLRKLGNRQAVGPLIRLLTHWNRDVQDVAASVLGELADERAVELLAEMLADEREDVQFFAAKVLATLGDARGIERLVRVLETEEAIHLRSYALVALANLGDVHW